MTDSLESKIAALAERADTLHANASVGSDWAKLLDAYGMLWRAYRAERLLREAAECTPCPDERTCRSCPPNVCRVRDNRAQAAALVSDASE